MPCRILYEKHNAVPTEGVGGMRLATQRRARAGVSGAGAHRECERESNDELIGCLRKDPNFFQPAQQMSGRRERWAVEAKDLTDTCRNLHRHSCVQRRVSRKA